MDQSTTEASLLPSRLGWGSVFACLFSLVLVLQYLSGAYGSEFAGYPDEPAHYVSAVMVHDYLLSGNISQPLAFADNFAKHYPKVAIGHWPPLLYAVQGAWMVVFSDSRTSILYELALTTTIAGLLLFFVVARHFGYGAAVFSSIMLVCLPIIQTHSDEEMAESLLLVTTFAAAIAFYRYLEHKTWQSSFLFGFLCSLAILTKGNGWALMLIPPIAIALTRDFAVLRLLSFWIPVPLVGALCLPWQILTLDMAKRGWTGGQTPNFKYTFEALGQFARLLPSLVGWAVIALATWGIIVCIVIPIRTKRVQALYAVMFGLLVSIWVFHSVVPAGVEKRKLINALPALGVFAVAGAQWLACRMWKLSSKLTTRFSSRVIACSVALLFAVGIFTVPQEQYYGFTEASHFIEDRPDLINGTILVSSERDGEGLLISELLMNDKRREHTVLRASKLLSQSDWNGNVEREFVHNAREIMNVIKRERVRMVVLDTYPSRVHYLHNDLLVEASRLYPAVWQLKSTFGNGYIRLYEITSDSILNR